MNDTRRNTILRKIYTSGLMKATLVKAQQQFGMEDLPGRLGENPALAAAGDRDRFLWWLGNTRGSWGGQKAGIDVDRQSDQRE